LYTAPENVEKAYMVTIETLSTAIGKQFNITNNLIDSSLQQNGEVTLACRLLKLFF